MTFDFGGARLEVGRDRELLIWIFNQFLYGEVTGIQVGHWLYRAPSLDAAHFLARQAMEELQHVDRFCEILELLSGAPEPPHPVVRFLSTGMMGDDWAEHVCLEMALGEGLVLTVLYALIDTIDDDEIRGILSRTARQEERHVAFGETQTQLALRRSPRTRGRLFGLSLYTLGAVGLLARATEKRAATDHPVLKQLPDFVKHIRTTAELRLQRLGLVDRPVTELPAWSRWGRAGMAGAGHLFRRIWPNRRLLTKSYLDDPRLSPGARPRALAADRLRAEAPASVTPPAERRTRTRA